MYNPKYQTVGQRIGAAFIDGFVLAPIIVLDAIIFSESSPKWLIVVWMSISYSAYWVYSVLLHGFYGQTVGKRVAKIRVVDNDTEDPITMRQALLRDSVIIVLNTIALGLDIYLVAAGANRDQMIFQAASLVIGYAAVSWALVEIITCLTNPKRRAVHDFIAGTVVVQKANLR
jgi:uncharacterized RDD family membrane protein YckC